MSDILTYKYCPKCGETKPVSDFYIDRRRNQPRPSCKDCENAATKAHRREHPEGRYIYMIGYRKNNQSRMRTVAQAWYVKRKPIIAERRLLRKYGINLEKYNEMFSKQGGVCAICGEPNKNGIMLSVDHDHNTGVVRELLCNDCNVAIGLLKENPIWLKNAIKYLERWKK